MPLESQISPILFNLLQLRGIHNRDAFLDPTQYAPALPESIPNLNQASKRIQKALNNVETILIWGDLDVDGQSATALIYQALNRLTDKVTAHIPPYHGVRQKDLTPLIEALRPALLILTDTGSSAIWLNDYAKYEGFDVVVIDHHRLPPNPIQPYALVTTQNLASTHPLGGLTAVGIAFLLIQHLYGEINQTRYLDRFLDLVALGMIADLAPMTNDTRYWVQRGLAQLRKTKRTGLLALAPMVDVDLEHLTGDDIAFRIAPALNAFGRLDDPLKGFQLLTTRQRDEAGQLALQADGLNQKRKAMTRQMVASVQEQLENSPELLTWHALTLENQYWESGIIGAVAAQLTRDNTLQRPVALFVSDGTEDGIAKGSIRDANGYDVMLALDDVQHLLKTYGGHHSAAGLSLHMNNFLLFRRQFSNALSQQKPNQTPNDLLIDIEVPLEQLSLSLVQDLEMMAPFGVQNPRPILVARNLSFKRSAKLGRDGQHHRLTIRDEADREYSVFWWNSNADNLPAGVFDLAYQVRAIYKGDDGYEMQIMLVDWLQVEAQSDQALPTPDVIDRRENLDLAALRQQEPNLSIWAEGYSTKQNPGVTFSQLEPADALLIYTAPPTPDLLNKAIQTVKPQRIYLHAETPPFDHPQKLIEAVSALLRAAIANFDGEISLSQIAERVAHTPQTVQIALEALQTATQVEWLTKTKIKVISADQPPKLTSPKLEVAINETAAYRRYVRRVKPENLLSS